MEVYKYKRLIIKSQDSKIKTQYDQFNCACFNYTPFILCSRRNITEEYLHLKLFVIQLNFNHELYLSIIFYLSSLFSIYNIICFSVESCHQVAINSN